MTYDSLVNRGDYFSAHYLAEVFPKDLKAGLLATWKEREEEAKAAGATRRLRSSTPASTPSPCPSPRAWACAACAAPTSRSRAFFAEAAATADRGDDVRRTRLASRGRPTSTPWCCARSATTPSRRR